MGLRSPGAVTSVYTAGAVSPPRGRDFVAREGAQRRLVLDVPMVFDVIG
jgi:hypothetical protein